MKYSTKALSDTVHVMVLISYQPGKILSSASIAKCPYKSWLCTCQLMLKLKKVELMTCS